MPVVSIVNMKGGVAKTTLATNLADSLARRENMSVLLVDIDPQFNATQCLISGEDYVARRKAGGATIYDIFDDAPSAISPVLAPRPAPSRELKDIEPWKVKSNYDLLPGNLDLFRLEMGGGHGREQRLRRYLEAIGAERRYDYVIVDVPPTPSHWMMAALLASGSYLVPVKPEPLSRTGIDLLRGVVERCSQNFGHPIDCSGVVLTIAEANTVVYRESLEALEADTFWRGKRYNAYLPKRTALANAQKNQELILDLNDNSLKLALAGITRDFLDRTHG